MGDPHGGGASDRAGGWFDVEDLRSADRRVVVLRCPARPALVLGSTQDEAAVSAAAARSAGVTVVRRRSGGGAVLVGPADPVWVDWWVPRGDVLFDEDVSRSAAWVGECWASVLGRLGCEGLQIHRGPLVQTPWSRLVCFAGTGPGEVTRDGRKVVGIAQWRCRQGALYHSAAYRRWQPDALVDLLDLAPVRREVARRALAPAVSGLDELVGAPVAAGMGELLLADLPAGDPWEVRRLRD